MTSLRRLLPLAALGLLTLAAGASAQKKYSVKLDRARHVGQSYRVDTQVKTERSVNASVAGTTVEHSDSSYSVHFIADAVVTAIDPKTKGPEITYTVRKCVHYGTADTVVLAPPGTKLIYTRNAEERHLRAANDDLGEELLNDIEDAVVEVGVGAGEMQIGAREPKPVGGAWEVSLDKLAQSFGRENGFLVEKGGMKGKATLVSVSETGATPSMKVKVDIDLKKFTIPGLENFKMKRSGAAIAFLCEYPIDETKLPLDAKLAMDFTIQASGKPEPGAPTVDLDMRFVRESRTLYTYE